MVVSIDISQLQRRPRFLPHLCRVQTGGEVTPRLDTVCPGRDVAETIQPGGVVTRRLGTFASMGVQAERGMVVDKEVRGSSQLVHVWATNKLHLPEKRC